MSLSHFHDQHDDTASEQNTQQDELYRATILDHNAHPRNRGPLEDATVSASSLNPSCGDKFALHLRLSEDGKTIEVIRFEGVGCAISTASLSMASEQWVGLSIDDARALTKDDVYAMLGVPISPAREKCALVSVKTLREALQHIAPRP